jgi:MFS transporter, OFA family, oxalate/formate antiporter
MNENPDLLRKLTSPHRTSGGRVFYGWWVLAMCALINGVGNGIIYQSFTVFFLPLKRDLGVSSAAISLLYGAARLEGGIDGPIYGYLIDRFGSRKMIMIGASLAGIGLILLSMAHSFLTLLLIYVFVVSVGNNSGFFHPLSTAVNKWFIRRRGLGLSIITSSGCVGGMIMAPLLSFIILNYGWRTGTIFAGLLILAVTIPAAIPIRRSPEEMGLYPDGRPPVTKPSDPGASAPSIVYDVHFSIRQALRTIQFWLLTASLSLRLLVTIALNTHFVPILVWRGMEEASSAYLVSLFAFCQIPLAIGLGWMGDRRNKARLSCYCIIPNIVAMMGMVFSDHPFFLYFFPIAFAIAMGATPLNWALIGDFFGRGSYATLRGLMGIGYGTATFLSPIYAGWIFDKTESYALVLVTFSFIFTVCAVLFAILRPPNPPTSKAHNPS